jgi:uncharacterized protein YneF (UPF0154 family)
MFLASYLVTAFFALIVGIALGYFLCRATRKGEVNP